MAGRSVAILLALALSTVLFRALGRERFGLWSLFAFLVGYSGVVDFGLSAAVERQVAYLNTHDQTGEICRTIGQALLLVLAVGCGLQAMVFFGVHALDAWLARPVPLDVLRGVMVLPVSLAVMTGSLIVGSGLSGLQRMVAVHAWRSTGMALGTVATAALALSGVQRMDVLLLGYTAGAPIAAAGQWWHLLRAVPTASPGVARPASWRLHGPTLGRLVQFGGVLQVATVGPMVGEYAFRVLVSQRFGIEYVGIYDLAARAAIGLRSLASALFVAMVPFSVPLLATADRLQATRLLRLAVKYTALFMLPSSILLYITADPVVHWWLGTGPGAAQVAATLRPLLIFHALISLTVPMAMIGRSAGLPAPEAVTAWSGVVAGLGAGVLAPTFARSVILFASAPLVAGIALWSWLGGTLRIPFESGRDLLAVACVAAVGAAVAAGGEHMARWRGLTPAWAVFAGILAGAGVVVASVRLAGLVGPRERALLTSLVRPAPGRGESPVQPDRQNGG
jgi:O-antigen/teichoic acid export membrane protein